MNKENKPVKLNMADFGLPGSRKPIDVEGTIQVLAPFVAKDANLVINDVGQVTTTASEEFRRLPELSKEQLNQLGSESRIY